MPFRITFASSNAPDTPENEDFVAATDTAAVVLDGVSVPPGLQTGCIHGTPWYVRQLGTTLLARLVCQPQQPLTALLADAITYTASLHADTCDLSHPGTPAATTALLRLHNTHDPQIDWLLLSDSILLIQDNTGHITTHQDQTVENTATTEFQSLLTTPISDTDHAKHRSSMITTRQHARNRPGGYWIAAANPAAANHALTGTEHNPHATALLTDGAARLVEFGLTDWPGLLTTLTTHGPTHLINQTRQAEHSDPNGQRWPRSKRHDDATALLSQLN